MAPLLVQVLTTLLARAFTGWRDAARIGLAVMFAFTASTHFSSLKYDFAAMIPPPLTGALWVIYVTGVLELAGAVGLLMPGWRRLAAICLALLLIALFPANIYAAMSGAILNGAPASALWWRTPLQAFWLATLWWSTIAQPPGAAATAKARP
jgi:uncharacterized membrane protein